MEKYQRTINKKKEKGKISDVMCILKDVIIIIEIIDKEVRKFGEFLSLKYRLKN